MSQKKKGKNIDRRGTEEGTMCLCLLYSYISHEYADLHTHTKTWIHKRTRNFLKESMKENMHNIHIEMYKILKSR